jgi:hypothetical protein
MHEGQQETLTQNSATIVCNGEEETKTMNITTLSKVKSTPTSTC